MNLASDDSRILQVNVAQMQHASLHGRIRVASDEFAAEVSDDMCDYDCFLARYSK